MSWQDPFDGLRSDRSDRFDRSDGLRAGDADRERTADALRRHHAEGRLRDDEFEQRIGRCYAARTFGELDALLGDLPGRDAPPSARGPRGIVHPGRRRSPVAVAVAVIAGLWLLSAIGSLAAWLWGGGGWGGAGGFAPHPPLIPLLVLGFLAWRFVGRRRTHRTHP